jgi:glycosyltransferase involved in cell wall biosynthesis
MNEATYAHHLRQSALYLPTTLQEGLHASVLEAMACGCLVVGFSGIGGNDFMRGTGLEQNCVLAENGDLLGLGRALEDALARRAAEPAAFAEITANAVARARAYQDAMAETEALVAFFDLVVAR